MDDTSVQKSKVIDLLVGSLHQIVKPIKRNWSGPSSKFLRGGSKSEDSSHTCNSTPALSTSHRFISPSLPSKTLNLAAFLTKREFYSSSTASWLRRAVASTRVYYSTSSSVSSNEPVVSVDWLHSNLKEPDLKVNVLLDRTKSCKYGIGKMDEPIRHDSMMTSTPLAWRFESMEFELQEDSGLF